MQSSHSPLLLVAGLLAAACGAGVAGPGEEGNEDSDAESRPLDASPIDPIVDGGITDAGDLDASPDAAGTDGGTGAQSPACGIDSPLSAVVIEPAAANLAQQPPNATKKMVTVAWRVKEEADQRYDLVAVELWDGYGTFAPGVVSTGTFAVEGNAATCGVCVLAYANSGPGGAEKTYIATSGSVTLTSISGTVTGQVSNLVFEELDKTTGAPLATSPCKTSLAAASFSAAF